ncbi:hypothetical protein EVAR_76399_1 [Eumeta japonica]|uniref:Uncharacterized protein n=1 Tax=Eumeta variegata TaxID=151549 RepID=A0A4C1T7T8_EUMVA|nr:hypothetical protein EVAR_76399_1 [Eumeta japonica]
MKRGRRSARTRPASTGAVARGQTVSVGRFLAEHRLVRLEIPGFCISGSLCQHFMSITTAKAHSPTTRLFLDRSARISNRSLCSTTDGLMAVNALCHRF